MEQQRTKKTAKWNIKQSKVTLIMILGLAGILLIAAGCALIHLSRGKL